MGMIEEIGGYLAASTGIGTLGTDVFLNVLPDSTRVVVGLFETGGSPPAYAIGSKKPAYTHPSFEVRVLSTEGVAGYANPSVARTKIQRIWNRLAGVSNATIGGSTYLRIEADGEPYLLDRDERGRVMFACSFSVMRRGTTSL